MEGRQSLLFGWRDALKLLWIAALAAIWLSQAVTAAGRTAAAETPEVGMPAVDGPAIETEAGDTAALGAAGYSFGFKRSEGGRLPSIAREPFNGLLQKYGAIFLGNTAEKELYLTFDNGYENGYTAQVLDTLKEKRVPAVFFVTGHYVKDQPELLRRMVHEGHLISNHSWSHPDMSTLTPREIADELLRVEEEVVRITGQLGMEFMRAPRGVFSERTLAVARQLGYTNVFWSVAYADWDTKRQQGADYAYRKVMDQLHPGAVILLHAVSQDNAQALGRIIDDARKQGYVFKRLDQMRVQHYR